MSVLDRASHPWRGRPLPRAGAGLRMSRRAPAVAPCPCQGGAYSACCGRLLDGQIAATSALELMRARYSATVLGRSDFLRESWDPQTCPSDLEVPRVGGQQWLGLEIRAVGEDGPSLAWVEFVARYRIRGRGYRHHERSRFAQLAGRWLYRDGVELTAIDPHTPATGRRHAPH